MKNNFFISMLCATALFFSIGRSEEVHSENQCRILLDQFDRVAMLSRNFIGGASNRWPNGVVPYTMSSQFSGRERRIIRSAMKHISDQVCVKFVKRSSQRQYVNIFTGKRGCYANLGFVSGRARSVLHLQKNGCIYKSTVIHELLHILGFGHEQSRFDRDNYVKIHWDRIQNGMHGNFWRNLGENESPSIPSCYTVGKDEYDNCYSGYRASTFGVKYDYGSIMHYGLNFFSKNGLNTITLKRSTSVRIPNRVGMSRLDVKKTRAAYKCKDEGPVGPKRATPGPLRTTFSPLKTPEPSDCKDTFNLCYEFRSLCDLSDSIRRDCKKTCRDC